MSTSRTNQGFTVVEGIMVATALAIIVALGVTFYGSVVKKNVATETTSVTAMPSIPEVKSVSDLDAASTDLDQLDLQDTDDSAKLTSEATAF